MKNLSRLGFFTFLFTITLFFSSCDKSDENQPRLKGAIIANAGNFGGANGSISLYDETTGNISNGVVKKANDNGEIGASIESVFVNNNTGYILCNTPDKIEIIDVNTFKYLDNPITGLVNPRQMAVLGGKGYVTCWGPYEADYTLKNSYIAIIDLKTNEVTKKIPVASGPQGIISEGSKLYIANSYTSQVTVMNTADNSTQILEVGAAPQRFVKDFQGNLWVSLGSYFGNYGPDKTGFAIIDPATATVVKSINIPGIGDDGLAASDAAGKTIYFVQTAPWPETSTAVYTVDAETYAVSDTPLISGDNFSALGCNPVSDNIYVADDKGYQGNGLLKVYDATGIKLDEETTGIGPYYFAFE